jgi:hypothetical protein
VHFRSKSVMAAAAVAAMVSTSAGPASALTPARSAHAAAFFATYIADAPIVHEGSTTATVHFYASGGKVKSFRCSLSGPGRAGAAGVCKSPVTYTKLAQGQYTFHVWALSPKGVKSAAAEATFLIR